MGVTGFEPVTSSVSGQNLCLGVRMNVASPACGRSLMSATMRAGWPTVNRLHLWVVVATQETAWVGHGSVSPLTRRATPSHWAVRWRETGTWAFAGAGCDRFAWRGAPLRPQQA